MSTECRRFVIQEVHRNHPMDVVSPADFVTEPAGEIFADEVLRRPRYSLYCFDFENGSALFVENDDPAGVDGAPFYYQAQAESAIGLVSMPLAVFHRIAAGIPFPPKGLIFVHSVGRCGSTLVSKVFQAIPSVHSLSEPDDLTQLVRRRAEGTSSDETLRDLLASSVKWRCKTRIGVPAEYLAIKPRSELMALADLVGASFPGARHIFLYRNAISWMRTIFRGFPLDRDVYDDVKNLELEQAKSRTLPIVLELRVEGKPMNLIQIRILAWIACMEGYFQLAILPIPTCAGRFEDLTSNPLPIVKGILGFCGIDSVDWGAMEEVLSRDSQAGTMYDREERRKLSREMTEELVQDVYDLVGTRPLLKVPDVVLPGTLQVCEPMG